MEPLSPPLSSTGTNLRLGGTRLPLLRAVFVILALATAVFFSLGVPFYFQNYIENIVPAILSGRSPELVALTGGILIAVRAGNSERRASTSSMGPVYHLPRRRVSRSTVPFPRRA